MASSTHDHDDRMTFLQQSYISATPHWMNGQGRVLFCRVEGASDGAAGYAT